MTVLRMTKDVSFTF